MESFLVLLKLKVIQRVRDKSSKVPCSIHLYATPEKYIIQNRFY